MEDPGRVLGGTWSQEALLEGPGVPKWLPNDLQEALLEVPEVLKWRPQGCKNGFQELQNDPELIPNSFKFEFISYNMFFDRTSEFRAGVSFLYKGVGVSSRAEAYIDAKAEAAAGPLGDTHAAKVGAGGARAGCRR